MLNPLSKAAGRVRVSPQLLTAGAATLSLAAPAVILAVWPEATTWFEYVRGGIAAGELWRLATGHWTHWSPEHLAWDLLAFVVLLFACLRLEPRRTVSALAASTFAITGVVWWALPEMQRYRGLSGLDSALYVLLAVTLARRTWQRDEPGRAAVFVLTIAVFAAKVIFEIVSGTTAFVDSSGFVPVPLAHVIGGTCGALAALTGSWRGVVRPSPQIRSVLRRLVESMLPAVPGHHIDDRASSHRRASRRDRRTRA